MAPAAARTQAAGPIVEFQIPESSLDSALQAYAHQSGRQLLYRSELVEGRRTSPLKGRYSADEALRRLLDGAPIATRQPSAGIVILSAGSPTANSGIPARLTPRARRRPAPAALHADSGEGDIIVTGSHIRGADEGTSPVAMIDRDQIDRQGHTTVAQTIAALPQNFSGMASEQSALTLADGSGTNASLATGVNLRGLGAGATLVLVNGRRLAGTGTMGDFNDVSSVPSATVERVEVLLDGASALYGSDAVGGVVNIILTDHYEGAQTRLQLGSVTKGGSREVQLGQTIGTRWATGSALLSYEYYHRDTLDSDSRAYARSADLRSLGGTDHRQFYSQPGNILSFDPATGAFGPAFAIPSRQNGTKLTPGDLLPGVVNLENQRLDTDLLPSQTRHSVYGRIAQDIGDHITLSIDARYSRRNFAVHGQGAPAVIVVTGANPYFVSPTGSPFDIIAYSFGRELGSSLTSGFAETIGISGGADVDLGHRWKARVYAAFAQQREQNRVSNIVNTQSLSEALGSVPNDPATAFNPAVDGYFNPYGDGPVNSAGILDFVGAGFQLVRSRSRVATYNIDADGPLFELPGGSVKLAVGGNIRRENFVTGGSLFLFTDAPTISPTRRSSRTVKAAFAELRIPLTGPDNAMPGVQRLEITAAGRIERYDDFGTTTNPKVGILWSPVTGVRLRSSYGTSFRAPNLREVNDTSRISATILPQANGTQTAVILMSGGNPDLGPEKARSWSAGIDLAPPTLRGLRANITWFRTRFDYRIGRPALDDLSNALINPALTPFVDYVSPSTDAADLARVTALLNDPSSTAQGSFPARSIGAIVDTRYVNTATTDVSGVDFAIGYAFDSSLDHFELGATGSYLLHYREKLTPTAPSIEEVNLAGHPVRFRGRLTGDWSHGAVGAGLTLSYANAYHDLAGHRVGSWSTIDFQLRYQPKAENGPLHGLRLAFNVQNLFDQDPPFYDSTSGVGYDAANADALGRFVSLQLTKEW